MVLPYGGTFSSCREYVEEAVREKMGSDDPFGDDYRGAMIYLSKKVWEGMGVKIEAARLAMSWLQKVARVMAKHDLTVEWTTPSGFRAKQQLCGHGAAPGQDATVRLGHDALLPGADGHPSRRASKLWRLPRTSSTRSNASANGPHDPQGTGRQHHRLRHDPRQLRDRWPQTPSGSRS